MSSAVIFSDAFEGHQLRVVGTPESPLFVAADVCEILGIKNARDTLAKRIPDDEKGVATIYTPGGPQIVSVVTEAGLYRLIFRSNKDEAKRFQRWVFHEVLPAIRRTGSYVAPGADPKPAGIRAALAEAMACYAALGAEPDKEFLTLLLRRDLCRQLGEDLELADDYQGEEAEPVVKAPRLPAPDHLPMCEVGASEWLTLREFAYRLGYQLADNEAREVGRIASNLYRDRHGQLPAKRQVMVGRDVREQNHYCGADEDLVRRALSEALGYRLPRSIGGDA